MQNNQEMKLLPVEAREENRKRFRPIGRKPGADPARLVRVEPLCLNRLRVQNKNFYRSTSQPDASAGWLG